jgi:MYXO-CTERM domain-containing protein
MGCFRDDDCLQPTAYCNGANSENAGRCVECINDTQCLGRRDGRTRCTSSNVCAAPPADTGAVQDGGCGCRARANTTGRFTLALFALALASLATRRRR